MPGSRKKVFLFLILTALIYMLYRIHEGRVNSKANPFIFSLHNTPYKELVNGSCSLKSDGKWNCPDIRSQGTNKLRQSQLVMTRMLLIFDALAKKYNVSYWITRGTLLGAARHKGFIPWDIDLDIEMPIQDYLSFFQNGANELAEGMTLQHLTKEQSFSLPKDDVDLHKLSKAILTPWNPRFRDDYSCYMFCVKGECNWHDGLMIDIYPVILQDGFFFDQFAIKPSKWRVWFGANSYGNRYKAFPLDRLQFEGFEVPVQNEWKRYLESTYGKHFMDLPSIENRFPPNGLVPEPNTSCPRPDQQISL